MDRMLRRATPIVLLLLAAAAFCEPWLPQRVRELAGQGGITRWIVGILCIYVVLLIAERERMGRDFKQVLQAFREFHTGPAASGQAAGTSAPTEGQKREALEILVSALESQDSAVRAKAHSHLKRITGQDLPAEPTTWRSWLAGRP